ncbi:conserved hypothetical protein [Theileria orientalis strain Shintoku]|uniref:E3 UFM1-protein ligase 1-like N-terminal domain-containing protein n=1 Tax=Theileria orientalis strain Shintoku TaxID=869250 RepID=J4DPN6_THEOR|nr:conserved hypothetical protein [Theileria orientalis strain Shintoku]BAM41019.1 conserved hypothetical protein [Theileria orientalis strain Shintoku]|eukprot:XP_009691320.1 conserved hypothetical protein [Theileria orientalis strain Shintoku]
MPSIAELRSRLASAQSRKAKARLSNLQCIDILLKVCRKKNVNVIMSSDGMLFYTIEEVQNEVENELLLHGGRIPIFQLNAILNFQPDYIDKAVNNITKASDDYLNSHGVIISRDYVRNLMAAINDRVQECGTVAFSELSKEYDLPLEMIKSYVNANVGTVIKGIINGNIIESQTFEERKVNNLKAALLAVTTPMATQEISRIIKININVVNDMIQDLLKKEEVHGMLKGGEYTPRSYMDSVESYLANNYSRNGYVEVKLVKTFAHLDAKLVEKIFPNNLKLDSVYINKDLFQPVSILINEAISSRSWREVSSMLPGVLNQSDWTLVVNSVKNAAKSGLLMDSVYVSNSFKEDLIKYLIKQMSDFKDKVKQFYQVFNESKLGSGHLSECVELILGYESVSDNLDLNADGPDKDDEKGNGAANAEDYESPGSKTEVTDEMKADAKFDIKDNHFVDLYQVYPEQLLSLVEEDLKKELMNMIVSAKRATKTSAQSKITKDTTETLVLHIMESEMALKTFEKVEHSANNVLLQFMAKELCSAVFNLLLEYYLRNNKLVEGAVELDATKRIKMLELILDEDVKAQFGEFAAHLKSKDAAQCVSSSRELCKLMYINYNLKRDSRNFLKAKQTQFNQQLSSLTHLDALLCCYVCVNLVLLKGNHYLFFSEKLWCLKETLNLFQPLLSTSEHFDLIRELVDLAEEVETKGEESGNRGIINASYLDVVI